MAIKADLHPELTYRILGSAMKVHRALGPGLIEKTYRRCLEHQLKLDGMDVACEVPIDIEYEGLALKAAYFADLVIDGKALVELKAVEEISPVHATQVITYLKLAHLPVGLLINFNVPVLTAGIRRFANSAALRTPSRLPA
ncbi:MAG TPA: GxxExxY protein [Usitatibacter sp.]|nr:GxxExxY protein [Usitatibacter sp.]